MRLLPVGRRGERRQSGSFDTMPSTKRVAAAGQWSALSASEARARLASRSLPREFHALALQALRRDEGVLWCDGSWIRPRKVPVPDLARIALIVIDGPVTTGESLSLRHEDIVGGGHVARDSVAFLFLGEVSARDVFAVPEVLALFAEGLTVERLAALETPDGHVQVARHLHAPLVVSRVFGGGVSLSKGTEVRIGAYARHIDGLPKKDTRHVDSLAELLPFLADQDVDSDSWARLEELRNKKFPASFVVPLLRRSSAAVPRERRKKVAKPNASAIVAEQKLIAKKKGTPKAAAKQKAATKRR